MLARYRQRLIRVSGLLVGLHALPAIAAPIASQPGRAIQVGSCTEDPGAPCWRTAKTITRFAAHQRERLPPVEAEIRLARQGQALLVNAAKLPDGHQLEVLVGGHRHGGISEASALVVQQGLHRLDLGPSKLAGTIRTLWVHLRHTRAGEVRTWAPHNHGDFSRPAAAWFSDAPPTHKVNLSRHEDGLVIQAKAAAELRLVRRRPILPSGGRGIPKPWSRKSKNKIGPVHPPDSGWHDIEAVWRAPGGDVIELVREEIYLRAEGAPQATALGIYPAPKQRQLNPGAPFSLKDGFRVCTGQRQWRPVARLARLELQRLTGRETNTRCQLKATANSIRLVLDERLPSEGFRVQVTPDHIEVAAPDLRGALYGALAAVDGIGPDGELPAGSFSDSPAIAWRILHHRLVQNSKSKISVDSWVRFLRRAVSRGRYNTIVLDLSNGYRWASHPELARPNAWTRKEVLKLVEAARELGIEVIPGLAQPGHAEWITAKHPHLAEDGASYMLCTRHPDTRTLLSELMSELIDVFDQPRYLHIGHDEMWWRTQRKHEDQRCPRCSGSPRWQLVLDDLLWHHEWLKQRGVKPMLWSDMLVKGWHGKNGAIYRAADAIPEAMRADFMVVSWTRVGDTLGELVPKNFPVVRGHTGYHDWKRQGLPEQANGLTGEALAMFFGTPWSSFGGEAGPTPLGYHWSAVILAGTTAWRPSLANTRIEPTLDHLSGTTAFLPGLRHIQGAPSPLPLPGEAAAVDALLPATTTINGATFDLRNPIEHSAGPLTLQDIGTIEGLSLLHGLDFNAVTERQLIRKWRHGASTNGVRVIDALVEYTDGTKTTQAIHLGMDIERVGRPVTAQHLWRSSGMLRVPSLAAGAVNTEATDRAFARWDWVNPRPDIPVKQITFTVLTPEVRWFVLGATTWRAAE